MYIPLKTRNGTVLINTVKVNVIEQHKNAIIIKFTSDKAEDLVYLYDDAYYAEVSFKPLIEELQRYAP